MATNYQIGMIVAGITRESWEKDRILLGYQLGYYSPDKNWSPYDGLYPQGIKNDFNFLHLKGGVISILLPMWNQSPSQDEFLRSAYKKKTKVKELSIFLFPENNIFNPLDILNLNDVQVISHLIIGGLKKYKVPGLLEVFTFKVAEK